MHASRCRSTQLLIQEQVDAGLGEDLLKEPWVVKDGHIDLPTKPGLGIELIPEEAEQNINIYEEELGGEHYYEMMAVWPTGKTTYPNCSSRTTEKQTLP